MLIIQALDTGMRSAELLDLRFGDINWDRQLILVRPGDRQGQQGTRRTDRNDATAHAARVAPSRAGQQRDACRQARVHASRWGNRQKLPDGVGTRAHEGGPVDVTDRYDRVRLDSAKAAVRPPGRWTTFKFFQDRLISPLL